MRDKDLQGERCPNQIMAFSLHEVNGQGRGVTLLESFG